MDQSDSRQPRPAPGAQAAEQHVVDQQYVASLTAGHLDQVGAPPSMNAGISCGYAIGCAVRISLSNEAGRQSHLP